MRTALVVTSYRRPDALRLVLSSVATQTCVPFEVLVADDGSEVDVQLVIDEFRRVLPIRMAWQPDRYFRAARIRNLGIMATESDHVVFIDGDCVLPPTFIEAHRDLVQAGRIVSGGRLLLDKSKTAFALANSRGGRLSIFSSWKFWRLPLGVLRDLMPLRWEAVRTCNVSVMRSDLLKVAGFDENYSGWGHEDSDLVIRLLRGGSLIRSARFSACVAHLHHQSANLDKLAANAQKLKITQGVAISVLPDRSCLIDL